MSTSFLTGITSHNIAGIRVDNVTEADVLDRFGEFVQSDHFLLIVTPNVDHVVTAQQDSVFRRAINTSALSLPDGSWLVRGSRILGVRFRQGLVGRKLVEPVCERAAKNGWSMYILASWGDTAKRAADVLMARYPGLKIVGARSPSGNFGKDPSETEDVLRELERLKPDILFLGVGAPKSEKWMTENAARIPAKVGMGVGYAFDVITGDTRECPAWITRAGMEWAFRIYCEPRRLWKRYLVRDPYFFYLIFKQLITGPSPVWPPHAAARRHHHYAE